MAWTAGQVVQRLYKLKAPKVPWLVLGLQSLVEERCFFYRTGSKVLAFACLLLLWNTWIDHSQELFAS